MITVIQLKQWLDELPDTEEVQANILKNDLVELQVTTQDTIDDMPFIHTIGIE